MKGAKDFTPAQARRWIAQEAAKHLTPESRTFRIASEEHMLSLADREVFNGLPNSLAAHAGLLKILKAA